MGTPSTAGKWTLTYTVTNNNGTRNDTSDDLTPDAISFMVEVVEDTTPALGSLSSASFNRVTGSTVGADADTAFALPAITAATGNGAITESLTTVCTPDGTCAIDPSGTDSTPDGLTFTASSGATPAGLTGTFGNPGRYTVTYTVTDTAIVSGIYSGMDTTMKIATSPTYQPADAVNSNTVTFKLEVETAAPPTLATAAIPREGLNGRPLMQIDLPEASDGNFGLTDSLSAKHDGTTLTVSEMDGAISLSGNPTGLIFAKRTGDGAGKVATITGSPLMVGAFELIYKVVDGDRNMMSTDEKTVTVTLTVTQPMISLVDGEKTPTSRVVLVQDVALRSSSNTSTPITLPTVTGDVSAPAHISYVLTATQMAGGSGAVALANNSTAVAGLTYTEHSGSTAGTLSGTPTAAGIWYLTYTVTDGNNTSTTARRCDSPNQQLHG